MNFSKVKSSISRISMVLTLLLTLSIISTSVKSYAEDAPPVSNNESGVAYTTMVSYNKTLSEEEKNELEKVGWISQGDKLILQSKATDGNILVNGKATMINPDGTFKVEGNPEKITVALTNGKEEQTVYRDANGKYSFILTLNWESFLDSMPDETATDETATDETATDETATDETATDETATDETATVKPLNSGSSTIHLTTLDVKDTQNIKTLNVGYYTKYKKGQTVHCNRFNGPASDNVWYPKSDSRAYKNFVGSDCHIAVTVYSVGLCAFDYTSKKWCAGWGGNAACSGTIFHSKKYHKH